MLKPGLESSVIPPIKSKNKNLKIKDIWNNENNFKFKFKKEISEVFLSSFSIATQKLLR